MPVSRKAVEKVAWSDISGILEEEFDEFSVSFQVSRNACYSMLWRRGGSTIGHWNIPKVRVAEVVCCFKWPGQMWKFNDGKRERHTFVIKRIGSPVIVC